jgi:opacity protein-like surface antigen
MAKLDIPLIPIIPAVFIDYHILRGSGSFKDTTVENIQTSLNIFTLGIEGEYILLPLPFVKPFILVDLLYNDYGELNITSGSNTYVQPSKSSTGYAVGIGATLTIIPAVDFDLSLKYNKRGQDYSGNSVSDFTLNLVVIF